MIQKMMGHANEAFPPLKKLRGDVPQQVIAIIDQMTAKQPNQRFATPADAINALLPFCCGADSQQMVSLLDPTKGKPQKSSGSKSTTPRRPKNSLLNAATQYQSAPVPKPATQEQKKGPMRWIVAMVLASVLLVVVFLSGTIIRFVGNKGILVVELDDPQVELVIKQNDTVVVDKTTNREFSIKAGDGEVEVYEKTSGLKLTTKRFTLTRGGRETVSVVSADLLPPRVVDGGNHPKDLGKQEPPKVQPKPKDTGKIDPKKIEVEPIKPDPKVKVEPDPKTIVPKKQPEPEKIEPKKEPAKKDIVDPVVPPIKAKVPEKPPLKVGSEVTVTGYVAGYEDDTTDLIREFVEKGTKGTIVEIARDKKRCLVRVAPGLAMWILYDKLASE